MTPTVLQLSRHERVTVLAHERDRLVLEVQYDPHCPPPPRHLHPTQDEGFEVLSGSLSVDVSGEALTRGAGESFTVPAGVLHRMWNPFEVAVTARWTITPAGRTVEMFRELDALHCGGREPSRLAMGRVVARYGDGFRLAGPAGRLLTLLPR